MSIGHWHHSESGERCRGSGQRDLSIGDADPVARGSFDMNCAASGSGGRVMILIWLADREANQVISLAAFG